MNSLKVFFKLIRWFHVVLVPLPFLGLYAPAFLNLNHHGIALSYDSTILILLCLCFQLHVAAGCVLNDIMDQEIDRINKPKTFIVGRIFTVKKAYTIFFILSFLIFLLTIYIGLNGFLAWFIISPMVYLFSILYDVYFKKTPLFGNILMALLTATIPFSIYLYLEAFLVKIPNPNIEILFTTYVVLPTLIIIPRELSLDISDIEGDKNQGCNTLPILIGRKPSKLIVILFLTILIACSIPLMLVHNKYLFLTLLIDVSIVIYSVLLLKAKKRLDYIKIGRFLWAIMIFGLIGITLLAFP